MDIKLAFDARHLASLKWEDAVDPDWNDARKEYYAKDAIYQALLQEKENLQTDAPVAQPV